MYECLFKPFKIGNVEIKNRLVVPPMVVNYCTPEGYVTEKYIQYMEERAKGGWGLLFTEQAVISKQGKFAIGQPGLWSDDHVPGLKELTDRVHAAGAKIAIQINHGGKQASTEYSGEKEIVAPTAIPRPGSAEFPRELTVEEIHEIVKQFGQAALRAKNAGFDMIMEHGHHGYLIGTFLSAESNKRSDEYGGSLVNRFRFAKEVFVEMRKQVGPDYPIGFRISGIEFLERDEYLVFCRMLKDLGIAFLFLSDSQSPAATNIAFGRGEREPFLGDISEMAKRVLDVPVGASGYMHHPSIADTQIYLDRMDYVGLGRPSIVDPELPNKLLEGREQDVRSCLNCNQGCYGKATFGNPVGCVVNPLAGHEFEYNHRVVSDKKKKVLIAGGGIAGMEAAIFAAKDGHDVTIYESADRLGGQWLMAALPPEKSHLTTLTIWQKRQLEQLGVAVKLNTALTKEIVEQEKPDTVIVATGGTPITPRIPGVDGDHVVQAFDILSCKTHLAPFSNVAVIGGGLVGAELATHLAVHSCAVSLIEMTDAIAADMVFMSRPALISLLEEQRVNMITGAKVTEIKEQGVVYEKDGQLVELNGIDTVVLAVGARPCNTLATELENIVPQVITIGDANAVRNALEAVREGYEAAMKL